MINNHQELETTPQRIRQLEQMVAQIRQTETNSENYRRSASGFLLEIDRMYLEIRDYLWSDLAQQPLAAA